MIGRRPPKAQARAGGIAASSTAKRSQPVAPRSSSESEDASDTKADTKKQLTGFALLKFEEEERERYAKEFEQRSAEETQTETSQKKSEEWERKEHLRLLAERKGKSNPIVFFEIEIRGRSGRTEASGRLEIELFADIVPRTAENFRCLCTGEKGGKLSYKNATFHRIIPGFMAQGGDITHGDGTGGLSIYGPRFADESFKHIHSRCNLLSMANSGPNTNNSQFFVLFQQCKHLDRKHVVFGEIIREDGAVMKRMITMGSDSGDVDGSVVIVNCGELKSSDDFQQSRERFRRSPTRSASRRRKQRKCYI